MVGLSPLFTLELLRRRNYGRLEERFDNEDEKLRRNIERAPSPLMRVEKTTFDQRRFESFQQILMPEFRTQARICLETAFRT